ncbi:unnamed protein product, partial [Onchocerca ochengi]
ILGIISSFSTFASGALFGMVGARISMRLRIAVFKNILRQDLSFFDREYHSTGELTERLANDAQDVKAAVDQRLANAIQGIISLSSGILVAFLFNWKMAGIGVAICTVLIILQIIILRVVEALNVASFIMLTVASYLPEYLRARISANLMFQMKDQKPLIDNLSETGIHQPLKGNIRLENVYFAYPMLHQNVLRNFSMSATFGQKIALVGSSGCGKSTIIKLLERFYDVTRGVLFIDDRDIRSYNIRYLRSNIALVDQEPTLFNLSIRDNIAYGLDNMSQDQIESAAKLANIHDFIISLPQGYDTIVGSKGSQLSGGQKQRIAIARAIIRNPKILILDEATSALDSENEKMVQDALEAARRGRTCIVIAHRLKTVQNADLIIVLKDGRVVECGNHTQLLAEKGVYYCFVEKQNLL